MNDEPTTPDTAPPATDGETGAVTGPAAAVSSPAAGSPAGEVDPALRYFDLYREPAGIVPLTADERATLRLVNQRVAALPTIEDVIDLIFQRTAGIFPFDRIGLSFVEEGDRRVVSRYVKASYERVYLGQGYSEDLRGSSLERVLQRGTPRIIDDLERYLAEHPASRSTRLLVREGLRSSLTCPLIVEGRIVGFMFRSAREVGAYDQHHVELQMALTERLSQAVEKAWRIEQLTTANRNYFEMLGFVSHELKNPVASMVTDARLLADGYLGPLDQRQKDKLERLIAKGEYLLDLVREYLDLARVEGGDLRVSLQCAVPLVEKVVDPALDLMRPQIERAGMKLETELPPATATADCDPALLIIVLVNLLGNAVRYGRRDGRLRLGVHLERRRLRVTVWNEGPGFSRAERARLFRKFSRLQTPSADQRRGTGLGLYNSWRIVQLHHGHMRADARPDAWAEFTFEIPQPLCAADVADELQSSE
jgi:hypothetical protein